MRDTSKEYRNVDGSYREALQITSADFSFLFVFVSSVSQDPFRLPLPPPSSD